MEFSKKQKKQLAWAERDGLSPEQINIFRNPKFTPEQMGVARYAFGWRLSTEQVKFICRPEFTSEQMQVAVLGFWADLTIDEVSTYYTVENDFKKMILLKEALLYEKGLL